MTSIKFLIDENISPRVAEELSSMGYILIRSKYQSPDYICEILKKFLKKNRGALESKVKKLIVIRAKGRKD